MKMLKRRQTKTEAFGLLAIIFGLGLLYDFHQRGFTVINLLVPAFFIVFGAGLRQRSKFVFGNILFLMGALGLSFTLFSMVAIQWVFIAIIIYIGYHLVMGTAETSLKVEARHFQNQREFVRTEPMFKNFIIGQLKSPDAIYDLDDMDFQFGMGDVSIDLSSTLIPEGETVIMIRGMVGKIQLSIPYDVELSVQTSTLIGRLHILDHGDRFFNSTQKYRSKDYQVASRKIRIIASTLIGDIEVKNI
ncbi:MAG: cell wall-active antibiotics response protein LiaF [Turicibacter sp.]|nr:cell wall-active antibiotics response protein LiaF [Turicibacter sp.]